VVTQEFGCTGFVWEPPYGSCPHFHQGIDIANASGTAIRAAMNGVIAYVGWAPFGGAYVVVIGHAHGLETLYGHLLPHQVVRVGQYVRQGQLVGYMGNTGHSTGTHCHWAVTLHGAPVNPRNYL
jgi:murein DD-endopeptidase MepM/ murein hydrolase activator NlpD